MNEKHNFEPGDRVVIREWDDMKKEFGLGNGDPEEQEDYIRCRFQFVRDMEYLCGQEGTISDVDTWGSVYFEDLDTDCYSISTDMIRLVGEYKQSTEVDIGSLLSFMEV